MSGAGKFFDELLKLFKHGEDPLAIPTWDALNKLLRLKISSYP